MIEIMRRLKRIEISSYRFFDLSNQRKNEVLNLNTNHVALMFRPSSR